MCELWNKLRFLFRRRRFDGELDEEMRQHLEMKALKLMDEGVAEEEARYQAQRQFGNTVRLKESSRELWGWAWLETSFQDLRYGARMLRKNPGFTMVAVCTLALGIAVNTTIFSVVSGWLLKPPAVADPDRVVMVVSTNAAKGSERAAVSAVDFLAWRLANHVFESLAATDLSTFSLTGSGEPERLAGMRVSANYFETLGVPAMLGRTFLTGEDQPGRDHVAILSHGLWRRRFASDGQVIGKTVSLNGEKYVVVGVMPAGFRLTMFLSQLWTPLAFRPEELAPTARDSRSFPVIARVKSGIGLDQARAEMAGLARRAEQNHPASEKGWGANVMPLQEYIIQEAHIRAAMSLLMAAVLFVLVMACANIANLLLARSASRRPEIAIRTALGAGRARVIRQLLAESLLIAAIGGAAGLLLAYWGIDLLRGALNFNEDVISLTADVSLDPRVLAFTFMISVAAALVFGLAPAMQVSTPDLQHTLQQGGRTGDLSRGRGRSVLVGAEIALAMLLVTGAGLMIKATAEELGGDYGFDPRRVLTADISLTNSRYKDTSRQAAFAGSVIEKLRALPGVEAAGAANSVPFNAGKCTFSIQGPPVLPPAQSPTARYFAVSPDYFRVLRVPLIQGRAFRESDTLHAPAVAVINRAIAQRFFAGQDPIGRFISVDSGDAGRPAWREVVGMIADVKASFGSKENDPQVYEPYLQAPSAGMKLVVSAAGDPNLLAAALRRAVWSVDPDQPIGRVETVARMIDDMEGGDFLFDALLGIFGAMAVVLATVGIYGVMAYSVAERTHEIGIRMALGARSSDVLRSVIGKGMLLATVSTAIGLLAAAPLPKLFGAALQGYSVHGSTIFIGVPLLLLSVALAAIFIPAWRAARVDPMEALRHD